MIAARKSTASKKKGKQVSTAVLGVEDVICGRQSSLRKCSVATFYDMFNMRIFSSIPLSSPETV